MSFWPSKYAQSVDMVMIYIVAISVVLLLIVTFAMVYFVIRYNRKRNPVASQIEGNTTLEVIWIVVPVILVLSMFYFGYTLYHQSRIIPKDAIQITATARMWSWAFTYPNGKTADSLFVPIDKPVKITLKSMDVNHSLFIPAFRIKEDVIAGRENYMVITPGKVGMYDIECSQYCGLNHSHMYSKFIVLSQEDYNRWYAQLAERKESE
ncbi:MAG: cytochrome c oxidase subunit II [FCB group bacterium]|jgi:cytochrome c oxidase subunit 2